MHNSRRLLAIQRNVGLMFKAILTGVFLGDLCGVPNSNQLHVLTGGHFCKQILVPIDIMNPLLPTFSGCTVSQTT